MDDETRVSVLSWQMRGDGVQLHPSVRYKATAAGTKLCCAFLVEGTKQQTRITQVTQPKKSEIIRGTLKGMAKMMMRMAQR